MIPNSTTSLLAAAMASASAGVASAQVCEPRWSDEFEIGADGRIQALHDTPGALYAGGHFGSIGGVAAARVASLAGGAWAPLGPGFTFPTACLGFSSPHVRSLLEVDLPGLTGLVAGGAINEPPMPDPVGGIVRWDGAAWRPIGGGLEVRFWTDLCPEVHDMAVFDDGGGPALYVTGFFDTPAEGIARWSGGAWEPVGGAAALLGEAFLVHDDGSGAALYVAALARLPGPVDVNIARWDGAAWTPVGDGPGFLARDLVEFEMGGRTALVAGGAVSGTGRLAWWDGATWNRLGADFDDDIRALAAFDDGTGPALYAGGDFSSYDGRPISGLAKWDDAAGEWIEAAGGVDGSVYALEPAPHEGVWSLVVGGAFQTVGASGGSPVASQNIARLNGCASVCYADCDDSGDLTFFDFLCFQNEFAAQTPYADCDGSGAHDFFDFLCFQNQFAAGCP